VRHSPVSGLDADGVVRNVDADDTTLSQQGDADRHGPGGPVTNAGSLSHADGAAVLMLAGELDLAADGELRSLIRQALGNPMTRRVVVDVSDVTFAGSTALGALVSLRAGADDLGLEFAMVGVSDRLRRLIALTGLDETFRLDPS
jgi:anti-sigma B factor antagonist